MKERKGSESRRLGKNMWRMRKKSNKVEGARIILMNSRKLSMQDLLKMSMTMRGPHCSKPWKY
jgi:hypothetical protein